MRRSIIVRIVSCVCFCFATAGICLTASAEDNARILERINALENAIKAQQATIEAQQEELRALKAAMGGGAPAAPERITKLENEVETLKDTLGQGLAAAPGRFPVWASLPIQFSGYIKLDASYDSTAIHPGNYALWAKSESGNKNDNRFNMTANQTRLRVALDGPEIGAAKSSGIFEVDLYGNGSAENKPGLLVRHAFFKLDWPASDLSLLAGQTSDLFSPLVPDTLNYTVLWNAGNIGYRRPQLRLTKSLGISDAAELKLECSAFRTVGTTFNGVDGGTDAGYPGGAGRISVAVKRPGGKKLVVGVSGHCAPEESGLGSKHYKSWSAGVDLSAPVNQALALKGEIFKGQNLSNYFGGLGSGINTTLRREVESWGGWIGVGIRPRSLPNWRFNVNAGLEDINADDLTNGADGKYNRAISANAIRSFGKNLDLGLEVTDWLTKYKNGDEGDGWRVQGSVMYKF